MVECAINGCKKAKYSRGWCQAHYMRWYRNGDPFAGNSAPTKDPEEAFASRTEWRGECLMWVAGKSGDGYGRMYVNGKPTQAHRYAWKRVNGAIPVRMLIDHICHNKSCVNVDHLRLATNKENLRNRRAPNSSNRTSKSLNVYSTPEGRWRVRIEIDGKGKSFGTYSTIEEASQVASKKRRELFGIRVQDKSNYQDMIE